VAAASRGEGEDRGPGLQDLEVKVDGNCYEIYGLDKDGNKAEVYFDTKTLAVVKAEIKKK